MQQIITGSYPRFIATAVGALLSIVTDIGHIPPAVVTEHRGTVVFMIVIGGSNHQTIFIRRLYDLVDALHLGLCNLRRSGKGKKKKASAAAKETDDASGSAAPAADQPEDKTEPATEDGRIRLSLERAAIASVRLAFDF